MKSKSTKNSKEESDQRLRRLFNVPWVPKIPFGMADLPEQVRQSIGKMSLSGVQKKASVVLHKEEQQLVIAQGNGTHILKPDIPEYPQIALVENLSMDMAEKLEMEVPPHGVLPMADGTPAYLIKRFDRLPNGERIHKEDMAQLLQIPTDEKYNNSVEKVGKAIRLHATNTFLELINFYERVIFNFLIGNGDMHLKNWALIEKSDETKLAPCYDLVASRLFIPREDESALTINGKKNKLTRHDFETLARNLELEGKGVGNIFEKFKEMKPTLIAMIQHSGLGAHRKNDWTRLIEARYKKIFP
jgi:serine/threonine-protein kinase HipA